MSDDCREYEFTLSDGSKRYEIVCESKDVFAFMSLHRAVSAVPVKKEGYPPSEGSEKGGSPSSEVCAFGTPRDQLEEVQVTGSWGTMIVSRFNGHVFRLTDEPESYIENGKEERGYRDIVRVDVAEWMKAYPDESFDGCDILDIGYWLADGTYEPPVQDWRKQRND